jgi:hypothetical protein
MSIEEQAPTWTRTVKFIGVPLLGFMILQADGCFPFVRFSNDVADSVVGALSFLLPFLAAFFAFVIPRRWLTTIVVLVLLLPLLCFSALGLFFESLLIGDAFRLGANPSFERIARVPMGAYSVGIYLSDCGAPCSFDIDLLQERTIIPGVLLVRELPGFDEADQATYKVIGQDTLQVNVPPLYATDDQRVVSIPARSRIYHLKPFLYF